LVTPASNVSFRQGVQGISLPSQSFSQKFVFGDCFFEPFLLSYSTA
jgi:hypothetical protein